MRAAIHLALLVTSDASSSPPWAPVRAAGHAAAATTVDPCAEASRAACGASPTYCSFACAWNATSSACASIDNYPAPSNASLAELVGPASPLLQHNYLSVSF